MKKIKLFEEYKDLYTAYNDLKRLLGSGTMWRGLEIHHKTDEFISCGIRDWGNWEHSPYTDDVEDDDQMILSYESKKAIRNIVDKVLKNNPNITIDWTVSEKNWIDFEIEKK